MCLSSSIQPLDAPDYPVSHGFIGLYDEVM
jgi:hypothetical protein